MCVFGFFQAKRAIGEARRQAALANMRAGGDTRAQQQAAAAAGAVATGAQAEEASERDALLDDAAAHGEDEDEEIYSTYMCAAAPSSMPHVFRLCFVSVLGCGKPALDWAGSLRKGTPSLLCSRPAFVAAFELECMSVAWLSSCMQGSQAAGGQAIIRRLIHNVDHFMHACRPAKLREGKVHPDPIVETLSLAAVEPPDPNYQHTLQVGALCQLSASCVPFYLRMVAVCMQTL